jgi:UPF0755 protein
VSAQDTPDNRPGGLPDGLPEPVRPPRFPLLPDGGFLACLFVLALLGLAACLGIKHLDTPAEPVGRDKVFTVEPGQTLGQVARNLESAGLVHDELFVRVLARWDGLMGRPDRLRTGEFALNSGWTARRILDYLLRGPVVLYRVQVAEGLAWWQTARIAAASGLVSFEGFAQAMRDPELLRKYAIPTDSAEGYLFPETYLLPRPPKGDARPVVEAMLKEFRSRAQAVYGDRPLPDPRALHQLVVKASLVERESAVPAERPRIAGVFENRLKLRMPLQSDPTIIYGLGEAFEGNIRRRDLEDAGNPYNTYRHPGLPPGPICSPGQESLRAAAFPEKSGLLYFVARGDGSHQFSEDLEDHNRAVRKYILGRDGAK